MFNNKKTALTTTIRGKNQVKMRKIEVFWPLRRRADDNFTKFYNILVDNFMD